MIEFVTKKSHAVKTGDDIAEEVPVHKANGNANTASWVPAPMEEPQHSLEDAASSDKKGTVLDPAPAFNHERVARLAFDCWHKRGCPHDSPEVDWREAEGILRQHDLS
jgi:hypothetical protein